MDGLLQDIVRLLIDIGPWVVFAIALVETAAFVGLLIPAEATVIVAAFLADRGIFEVEAILAAALGGGLLGDQLGYFLGRYGGARMRRRPGRLIHFWQSDEAFAADLFRRHAGLAVAGARFISFVRTLMPWIAGASRMPYARFLIFDLLGVTGWAIGSVALGYLAGESWRVVAGAVGTASATIAGIVILALAVIALRRRRAARAVEPVLAAEPALAVTPSAAPASAPAVDAPEPPAAP